MNTRDLIIRNAKKIFAKESLDGLSMRRLASESNIALSVIYHYFSGKDELLNELYKEIVNELNDNAKNSLVTKTTKTKLRQYFEFCFNNAHELVFCHKYYLSYRSNFRKNSAGYAPITLSETIREILGEGIKAKEIKSRDEIFDSKIIFNTILGIILEYYPHLPNHDTRDALIQKAMYRLENALFV